MRWLLPVVVLLTACVGPAPAPPPTTYDLGLSPPALPVARPLPGTLAIAEVSAPAWLAGDGILYRLAYDDAARPQVYSQSRWVAPPPELLHQRLNQRLANVAAGGLADLGAGVAADRVLRVALEEFGQVFEAPDRSRVVLRARVTLVDAQNGALAAQKEFRLQRPAAPDAAGAARALQAATDALVTDMVAWLVAAGPPR